MCFDERRKFVTTITNFTKKGKLKWTKVEEDLYSLDENDIHLTIRHFYYKCNSYNLSITYFCCVLHYRNEKTNNSFYFRIKEGDDLYDKCRELFLQAALSGNNAEEEMNSFIKKLEEKE